jgi:ArsR family transcriptional regulator
MKDKPELNSLLLQLGNPIRRKIIKRLSQQPSYPLELSKEMGLGQQLIASHLYEMEKNGIVKSSIKTSPRGPNRRVYMLKKNVSIKLDFGPHLYNEKSVSLDILDAEALKDASTLIRRIQEIQKYPEDISKVTAFATILTEIDHRLHHLEEERAALLHIRNQIMSKVEQELCVAERTLDEKRVFYYILDERSRDIEEISRSLNLRESEIRRILEELKDEIENL